MPDETPRRGLNTFAENDRPWDHTDVVEDHDELSVERGSLAERPGVGVYDAELYLATDEHRLYQWDADAGVWDEVAPLESHGNEAHDVDFATPDDTFSGSYTDLTARSHGNEDHDTAFTDYTFSEEYGDLTAREHGMGDHDSTVAATSDLFSGSYTDLTDVPSEFVPAEHDNSAHSETYVTTDADASGFGGSAGDDGQVLTTDGTIATWEEAPTGVGGYATDTGDGSTTAFTWDTNATTTIEWASVDAASAAASTDFVTSISGTEITVTYDTPPADGESLAWYWSTNSDVDYAAIDSHGNEAHDVTFATESYVDGEVFSASYTDLTDVPSTFAPSDHGDSVHTENYATVDGNETITGSWTLQSALDLDAGGGLGQLSGSTMYLDSPNDQTGPQIAFRKDDNTRFRWRLEAGTDELRTFVYDSAGSYNSGVFTVDLGTGATDFGSTLNYGGEEVATQQWVDDNVSGGTSFSGDYNDLTNRSHGNEDHDEVFISDGDGVTRQVWVSSDGTIPSGAANDDIVLTEAN